MRFILLYLSDKATVYCDINTLKYENGAVAIQDDFEVEIIDKVQ